MYDTFVYFMSVSWWLVSSCCSSSRSPFTRPRMDMEVEPLPRQKHVGALYLCPRDKHLYTLGPFRNLPIWLAKGSGSTPLSVTPNGKAAGAAARLMSQHRGCYSPSGPGEVCIPITPRSYTLHAMISSPCQAKPVTDRLPARTARQWPQLGGKSARSDYCPGAG